MTLPLELVELRRERQPTEGGTMRYLTVKALWAMADVLEIVRDGLIVAASKTLGQS